ncbi:MAG: S46 family peptidase [Odoribacteraceae bacterium]|jgi:hypothetical protein|nr:S46 family peptidase [Odoribacteraceae bacterium]
MRTIIIIALSCLILSPARADEGMWIPALLNKYTIEEMQKAGFKLSAEDIYAINRASLKDAVVGLGREGQPFSHSCTGGIISDEGLVITNHHCSHSMIQAHSSLEHNYLRDGFWARDKGEELANPGITASILSRVEDVTEELLAAVATKTGEEREKALKEAIARVERAAEEGTNTRASIKPYFNGTRYFLSIFKIYRDVRLVGAPPSAIGSFGGDTDNWTWPRHSGDFSLLRIYAGEDNEPAAYAPGNRPYKPAASFKITTRGVQEGDFTMVFGYPGTTREYLPSFAIEQLVEVDNPSKIKIRTAKLDVIKRAMASDELLRIKYSAKAANVANAWKKWQGEIKGLTRFRVAEEKRELEERFTRWAAGKPEREGLVEQYRRLYAGRRDLILAWNYATEAGTRGAEVMNLIATLRRRFRELPDTRDLAAYRASLQETVDAFFKNYDAATDRQVLAEMLRLYNSAGLDEQWIPDVVKFPDPPGGHERLAADLFARSSFTDPARLSRAISRLDARSAERLQREPLCRMQEGIDRFAEQLRGSLSEIQGQLDGLDRAWMVALMEMQPERHFYPDANSTFRVAFGKVAGYEAMDAIYYKPNTTLAGIMQKDNQGIPDYNAPARLKELLAAAGNVPVCFVATNHTTGGNSGSPVLNADGHLVGLNFDRAWEGVMSDYAYRPEICRNISVDIRYVLFIIDKYAGANHLVGEMTLVE